MVKCITCGFAAKRARLPIFPSINRTYFELPFDERQPGPDGLPPILHSGYPDSAAHMVDVTCFRGKEDLPSLVAADLRSNNQDGRFPASTHDVFRRNASKRVLEEDRICPFWFPYEPGRTPQEHLTDYMWEQLEKQRQAFEVRLFEISQTSEENTRLILADSKELARENKEIVEQMKQSAEVSGDFNRRVNLWLIAIAVLTLLLAGLQVYFASRPQAPIVIQAPTKPEASSLQ